LYACLSLMYDIIAELKYLFLWYCMHVCRFLVSMILYSEPKYSFMTLYACFVVMYIIFFLYIKWSTVRTGYVAISGHWMYATLLSLDICLKCCLKWGFKFCLFCKSQSLTKLDYRKSSFQHLAGLTGKFVVYR
jgi:hypothetical protein